MPMFIFCHQNDILAFELYQKLRIDNNLAYLVTAEDLVFAKHWNHTIDDLGNTSTTIILQNGLEISSHNIDCVFNRIRCFSMLHFVNQQQRAYAEAEFYSLWVSFLQSINNRLLERIETRNLSIDEENHWLYIGKAIESGLKVYNFQMTTNPRWKQTPSFFPYAPIEISGTDYELPSPNLIWENKPALMSEERSRVVRVLIVGSEVFSEIELEFQTEIREFSRLISRSFFEMYFIQTKTGLRLKGINLYPVSLSITELEALSGMLISKSKSINDTYSRN